MENFKDIITKINDLVPIGISFYTFKLAYPKNLSEEHEVSVGEIIAMLLDSYYKSVLFQNKTLEEKDKILEEKDKILGERDKLVAKTDRLVEEKEERIKDKEQQIKDKNKQINDMDETIQELRESTDLVGALREMEKAGPRRKWGSTTRTQAWDRLMNRGAVTTNPRVKRSGLQDPRWLALDSRLNALKDREWGAEVDMYKEIIPAIEDNLYPDKELFVVDTHKSHIFPADISIAENSGELLPYSLFYFLEMKLPAYGLETSDYRGQVLDYLHMAREKQPYRSEFVGILSNLIHTLVYVATYDTMDNVHIKEDPYQSLADALFYADMQSKSQFRMTLPTLDGELVETYSVLAMRKHYFVLSVKHHPPRTSPRKNQRPIGKSELRAPVRHKMKGGNFVLKITHDDTVMANEREILEKFIGKSSPHVPEIVWLYGTNNQLGIIPVGRPVMPGAPGVVSRKVVEGLIEGLRYIHGLGIVHRDIRLSNLILEGTGVKETNAVNAVIVDFETARDLSQGQLEVEYEGGYICWPRRLLLAEIGRTNNYVPEFEDDLFASILVVHHMAFPDRFNRFNMGNIDPSKAKETKGETFQLLQAWEGIENSTVWGRFYVAAKERQYDDLLDMADLFYHI